MSVCTNEAKGDMAVLLMRGTQGYLRQAGPVSWIWRYGNTRVISHEEYVGVWVCSLKSHWNGHRLVCVSVSAFFTHFYRKDTGDIYIRGINLNPSQVSRYNASHFVFLLQ